MEMQIPHVCLVWTVRMALGFADRCPSPGRDEPLIGPGQPLTGQTREAFRHNTSEGWLTLVIASQALK